MYELLGFALQPRKSGLGGVDEYLVGKLCSDKPLTIKDAMLRLCKGMANSIQARLPRPLRASGLSAHMLENPGAAVQLHAALRAGPAVTGSSRSWLTSGVR